MLFTLARLSTVLTGEWSWEECSPEEINVKCRQTVYTQMDVNHLLFVNRFKRMCWQWTSWCLYHEALQQRKLCLGNYKVLPLGKSRSVLLARVSVQMKDNQVIVNSQHGFTKGKSCLINLIPLFDKMAGFESKERAGDVIYFNSSKAFDTVFHKFLGYKLWHYSLDGWTRLLMAAVNASCSIWRPAASAGGLPWDLSCLTSSSVTWRRQGRALSSI